MTDGLHHGITCEGGAVLDIGAGIGALVVHTTPALAEQEIEVSPAGRPAPRIHTVVHERIAGGRRVFAALFPALTAGDYVLWRGGRPAGGGAVTVVGGGITETSLAPER
jgi:hypothetical protein